MGFFPQTIMERPLIEMEAPTVIMTRIRISLDRARLIGPRSSKKPTAATQKRVRRKARTMGSRRKL